MIEVEVFGAVLAFAVAGAPSSEEVRSLCLEAAASVGVSDGHVAVEFVRADRIASLNEEHRGRSGPTDVLSFPIDGAGPIDDTRAPERHGEGARGSAGTPERELGDVVICPEHTTDLREAVVHGMLHLLGMDHETDDGEMLERQRELMIRVRR